MRWIIIFAIFIITLVTTPFMVFAQPMMGSTSSPRVGTQSAVSSDGHTAREEAEGKEIWRKLQAKQLECKNLTEDNFEVLGEYFMGQVVGSSHEAMNKMMVWMIGEEGEKQLHIVMGKRNSGCEPNAPMPQTMMNGIMPMVGGGGNSMMGFGNVMGWGGFGFFGFLTWIFWVVILVDLVLLGIWLWKKIKKEK